MISFKDALAVSHEKLSDKSAVNFYELCAAFATDEGFESDDDSLKESVYRIVRDLYQGERISCVDAWEIADCVNRMLESSLISKEDLLNYLTDGWQGEEEFLTKIEDFVISDMVENRLN